MIVFACPGCQNELRAGDGQGGQEIRCGRCGRPATVPLTSGVSSGTRPAGPSPAPEVTEVPEKVSPPEEVGERGARTAPNVHEENTLSRDPAAPSAGPSGELYDFLAPAQRPDEIGRLGPYRVLRVLGAGGMGVVFLAEDPHLERPVALKAMKPALAASESARKRFLREAKAMAALKHDHIVIIHQVGEDRGVPFLAMEYLEGELLDDRIKRERKLPTAEVLRVGREVADGLAAAHGRGLIHRDIKPGNVWLEGKRGRVKILDFGLARAAAADDAHLTQSGVILGTPMYMAPEQARGEAVDHRCDLFSLGSMLYRMCTGEFPFRGSDAISTLVAVSVDHPRPPGQIDAAVPPALSELIMRLLAKDRADRPASAQEVLEAIQRIEAGAPFVPPARREGPQIARPMKEEPPSAASVPTEIVPVVGGRPPWPRRWQKVGLALVVLLIGAAFGWWPFAGWAVAAVAAILAADWFLTTKTKPGTLAHGAGDWLHRRRWKFAAVVAVVLIVGSIINSNMNRHGPVRFQQGKMVIPDGFVWYVKGDRLFRLPADQTVADADLLWQGGKSGLLKPLNGTTIAFVSGGTKSYDKIGVADLTRQRFSTKGIPDSEVGTVIAVQLGTGEFLKLRIDRYYWLHDFQFPNAQDLLTPDLKDKWRRERDSPFGHVEVEWVLYLGSANRAR